MATKCTVTLALATSEVRVSTSSADKHQTLIELSNVLKGLAAGPAQVNSVEVLHNGAAASGTLTLSSASGTVGGVINGVSVTVTASGGDTATAAAIAAAINASTNALVAGFVTATSAAEVVTVTSVHAGRIGNALTFAATGTGVTASAGGRLTGGTANRVSFNR